MRKKILMLSFLISIYWAQEGANYLIITADTFYNQICELARWKTQKGVLTQVKRLSEIGSAPSEIRSYIMNCYNNWSPRPEFLLLVGSPDLLPPYTNLSDNQYADMSDDYRAELACGRFPCKTPAQCSVMIQKTLSYERTPLLTDSLWFRGLLTIVREDYDSDDTIYYNDVHFARDLALANGFHTIDSLARSRNHNQNDIVNSINQGKGFVLYRGSAAGNWWYPFYVNPNQTNNGSRLPIIISATCATLTLTPGESMVGEAWLKTGSSSALKGAVAFFGNARSDYNVAHLRSAITQGFFKGLFLESLPTLGQVMLRAKQELYERYNHPFEYQSFTLLGDPELNLWTTTPKVLNVNYPSHIPPVPTQFTVQVNHNGPVSGARVCLWKADDFYLVGTTNNSGMVTFAINPQTQGGFLITVTKRNFVPFQDSAWIENGDVGVVAIQNLPSVADSGSYLLPQALVKNFGTATVSFTVRFTAPNYVSTREVVGLLPESTSLVEFDTWILNQRGTNILQCSTELVGDANPMNDWLTDTVFSNVYDVGVTQILSPEDTIEIGDTVLPQLAISNFGNTEVDFAVQLSIFTQQSFSPQIIYNETLLITLGPATDTTLIFSEWIVTQSGNYQVIAKTMLPNDMQRGNDSLAKTVLVMPQTGLNEIEDQIVNLECYPNPFVNQVIIKANLPKSKVKVLPPEKLWLKIYDVKGKVISKFEIQNSKFKDNLIIWDGKDNLGRRLNSGIYFIRFLGLTKKLLKWQTGVM
ncbi:MAG: C25 family cysteine peptidase [candidate division WOR-3 bacterium]